ncbi:unnamed protein product [Pylaiella littoralis]
MIWVQQDNACPHVINNDRELRAAMSSDGWDIRMVNQSCHFFHFLSQLDLGFFRSVQHSLQDQTNPKNIYELVQAVRVAWERDPPNVLNRVWLSLLACLEQITLAGGYNDYKLPHLPKGRLENAGTLQWHLECSEEAWAKAAAALAELEANAAGRRGAAWRGLLKMKSTMTDSYCCCCRRFFLFCFLFNV